MIVSGTVQYLEGNFFEKIRARLTHNGGGALQYPARPI